MMYRVKPRMTLVGLDRPSGEGLGVFPQSPLGAAVAAAGVKQKNRHKVPSSQQKKVGGANLFLVEM